MVARRSRRTSSGFTYARFMTFLDARLVMLGPRMADGRDSANAALPRVNAFVGQRLSRESCSKCQPPSAAEAAMALLEVSRVQAGFVGADAPAAMAESRSRGTICGFSYERFMTVSYVEGARYARPKLGDQNRRCVCSYCGKLLLSHDHRLFVSLLHNVALVQILLCPCR